MTATINEYAAEIDAQRIAAEAYKEEAAQNYKTLVDDGLARHKVLQQNWDVKLELLVNEIHILGNSTADTEVLRAEMEEKLLKERQAYQRAQRRSIRQFQRQMDNLHKLVESQRRANEITMARMDRAIADIHRQLEDLSQQLTLYLRNQAQIIQ